MAKKGQLEWTEKQREIYRLLKDGKEFMAVVAMGYSLFIVSKVKNAIAAGQKPEAKEGNDGDRSGGPQDLIGVKSPKSPVILFSVDKKEISLDPLELNTQYRYYLDLAKKDNLGYSFSQVLTIGMQIVWILTQDIPLTENMILGILYK